MPGSQLVLDLALTIRHDGHGGVADDLTEPAGLTAWVREHLTELRDFTADESALAAVREVRAAVRALFARAVRPGEPSPADAKRLMPSPRAVALLNEAAARVPVVPVLDWPEAPTAEAAGPAGSAEPLAAPEALRPPAEPTTALRPAAPAEPVDILVAALARAAVAFLAGPDRAKLRACHAPRCVRYFLKGHPRQEWCKPSCGNRARVARHHERHRGE